MSDLGK